jgi:8-oxo-dGTP pyrophosphatase MutT (NUDIX family)
LLIRRRVSIGFIELIRGKYDVNDTANIQLLIDQSTLEERQQLMARGFAELWKGLWNGIISRRYMNEYEQARQKFETIRERGVIRRLCDESRTTWTEPEWGFPKGRRSSSESELNCALRETHEEAGIPPSKLTLLDTPALVEEYRASNGISYRYRYWVAEVPADLTVQVDPHNQDQIREISDVRWCSAEEAERLIRPYSTEKRAVLLEAVRLLEEYTA